jgi:flagellar biosynthesis protein FlhF
MSTATKTYRAATLADVLAQVRDELGPDAVVVRRREGREGGLAGFFQKAVIEVDAYAGAPSLDVRDDDAPVMPDALVAAPAADGALAAPLADAPLADAAPALAREAAAAGFAAALATAQDRNPAAARPFADPAVDAIPQPRDSAPEVVPVVSAATASVVDPAEAAAPAHALVAAPAPAAVPAHAPLAAPAAAPGGHAAAAPVGHPAAAPVGHPEADRVLAALLRAGVSDALASAVIEEAAVHGVPFADGDQPAALRPFVARALARRLDVAPLRGPGAVAIVGAGGSGKTAVIARLAIAYAAARRLPVAVIALRSKDGGAELARLLAPAGVPMWATDDVDAAAARIANLRRGALVLVDTPALPARMSADPFVTDALGADLRSLGVDEIHLAVPAVLAGEVARELLTAARTLGADRLAVTHSDATARLGMAIELAAESGLPISYLADSDCVRPAAAEDLAFALLP